MPRGHRRTQSNTITINTSLFADNASTQPSKDLSTGNHEITKLLAQSNDKMKEKVSSVDVLNVQKTVDSGLFCFGKSGKEKKENSRKSYMGEEYMLSIPEGK